MPSTVVNTYHNPMKNCTPLVHTRKWQQSELKEFAGFIQPVRHKSRIQTQICLPQRLSFKPLKGEK